MVELRPEFARETEANPGRGGTVRTPSGRTIPVRTTYADTPTAWRLEVAVHDGRLVNADTGAPLDTAGGYAGLAGWDTERPVDRFLYAMDPGGQLYAADPTDLSPDAVDWLARARPLDQIAVWHHSSFVAGGPVTCAGDLHTTPDGTLTRLSSWSGHYRPGPAALAAALRTLADHGLDLDPVLAEVVGPGGSVRIVAAAALAARGTDEGLEDLGPEVRRTDAIALVCRVLGAGWTPDADARLDQWVAAGARAADPTAFDPACPSHWNWLARWALEGRTPR